MVLLVFRIFFCSFVRVSADSRRVASIEGGQAAFIDRGAGVSLAKSCGTSCTSLLRTMLEQVNHSAALDAGPAGNDLLSLLAANVEESLARAKDLAKSSVGAASATTVSQHGSLRGKAQAFASENVPCATKAACAVQAMAANKCNYARVALQGAYNELNVATHVLGTTVSSLCGCVHSGHVSTCALRSLPAVCAFPYTVYSKAFAGSVQVWEAVKAATKKCIIHRGPPIAL